MSDATTNLALALAGGGARAAYQVGFLRSLARSHPDLQIPILTGVSAGAINAAYLANQVDNFQAAVGRLVSLWEQLTVKQLFRADPFALATNFFRWSVRLASGGAHLLPPMHGLMNTSPLRQFLHRIMETEDGVLHGIEENLRRGRLKAIGLTTTNYDTEQSITWVQSHGSVNWERPRRRSVSAKLTVDHVMASCALPLLFPAVKVDDDWHGDGGIQLTAPLSPALHLGAERILAISTRYRKSQREADESSTHGYPPPATVIGVLLNSVFLDMVDYDEQVMRRTNHLLRLIPETEWKGLRPVELLVLRPSCDLELLAADYESKLPRSFRHLTRGLGTRDTKSPDSLAMVLFAPEYVKRVMEIGEQDAERRRDEIAAFVRGEARAA